MLLNIECVFCDFDVATTMSFAPVLAFLSPLLFFILKFTLLADEYFLSTKGLFFYHVDDV